MFHHTLRQLAKSMCKDDRGATAIEYALIAGFLSIVIVVTVAAIGRAVEVPFSDVLDGFN